MKRWFGASWLEDNRSLNETGLTGEVRTLDGWPRPKEEFRRAPRARLAGDLDVEMHTTADPLVRRREL